MTEFLTEIGPGAFGALIATLAAIIGSIYGFKNQRLEEDQRRATAGELQRKESQLAEEAKQGQFDLATLWAVTQQRIDFYHDIAIKQTRRSFLGGQIAMYIGFASVIALGVYATRAVNGTAAIAGSAAAIGGGALSAFISATFLKAQTEASSQLKQFFAQPVDFIRILGAERLVETLDGSERAAAVQQIIKSMTPVSGDSIQVSPPSRATKRSGS